MSETPVDRARLRALAECGSAPSPDVVLALLDELERVERERDVLRAFRSGVLGAYRGYQEAMQRAFGTANVEHGGRGGSQLMAMLKAIQSAAPEQS